MGYWEWEKSVALQAWTDFKAMVVKHIPIEILVGLSGALVGVISSDPGDDVTGAMIGGLVSVFVLGLAFGLVSLQQAPYRVHLVVEDSLSHLVAESSKRQEAMQSVSIVGRGLLAQRVKTEEQWVKWQELRKDLLRMFAGTRGLIGHYEFMKISGVQFNPRRYVDKFNDEHERLWNEMVAVVEAVDQYLERFKQ